jgi:hypothetical protein
MKPTGKTFFVSEQRKPLHRSTVNYVMQKFSEVWTARLATANSHARLPSALLCESGWNCHELPQSLEAPRYLYQVNRRWLTPSKILQVNLRAAGPAAVLCVLFISIASVGVFGHGPIAEKALNLLIIETCII